ncbi:YkgJ family cysteine cluster protein [Myxococcaceae bacterium GXIMD 01537]
MTERGVHVCARCPRVLGASCCEPREGERLATLTRADVARISEHTGLAARRFVHEEGLTEVEAAEYEARRPLFRGYFHRGPVRLTLAVRAGACVFLDRERGCSLPEETRPVACRLYPFERQADGWSVTEGRYGDLEAAREGGGACLAIEEADGLEALLSAFNTTWEALEALGVRLAQEARAHGRG